MNRIVGTLSAIALTFTSSVAAAQTPNPWIAIPGTGYELKFADLEWGPEESIQIEARQTTRRSQRTRLLFACGREYWAIASMYSIEQGRWVPNPHFSWQTTGYQTVANELYNAVCKPWQG